MRGSPGLLCQPNHILQTEDRHQRRGFHQPKPVVVDAGNGEAQHLRQQHPAKHLARPHAVGHCRLELTALHGEKRPAKGFGVVSAKHKTNRQHPRDKGVEAQRPQSHQAKQAVDQHFAAKEQQQHDHQLGNAAHQRGVTRRYPAQPARTKEFNQRIDHAERQRHRQ
ncbi:hypothetical protein D3C78_1027920 [compost metagenome]